jgi:hypothetical protein
MEITTEQDGDQFPSTSAAPVDWASLGGGEIFDRLLVKGAKLGTVANKMIRDLKHRGYVSEIFGKTLAKTKEERARQRIFFVILSDEAVVFLRTQMVIAVTAMGGGSAPPPTVLLHADVSANVRARAMHVTDDPECIAFLELIFGGVNKKARREMLDDKSTRTLGNWKTLPDDKFNNPMWRPENTQSDGRVSSIDPSNPPLLPYLPEQLRTLFSGLRTQYSIFYDRYHRSDNLVEGDGEGADEFFNNFVRGDVVYFYMHLLLGGQAPRFCMRDLDAGQKTDVGLMDSELTVSSDGKRKSASDLTKGDIKEIFKPSAAEEERDKSISKWYALGAVNLRLQTLERTIRGEGFDDLPDEVRSAIKKKRDLLINDMLEL